MTKPKKENSLTEDRRKEVFLALVDAQDHEMNVVQSRKLVAEKFGITDRQLQQIEREGLEEQWPPLS